jgi:hypothetical protein
MSERSIYLRDQARKCMAHAAALSDDYTQHQLRALACQYTVQAAEIESKEAQHCSVSPTLWGPAPPIPDAEPQPI